MPRKLRRYWPVLLAVCAAGMVGGVHLAVNEYTREPPNYSKVEEGFWLGGFVPQPPRGTNAVLNLCETEDPYRVPDHRWQPIADAAPAPSLDWLKEQVDFISANRHAGKTIYVHCLNGVSRSGMVVVAYYMAEKGWTREESMAFVRSRRPGLRPNPAFRDLLREWESKLKE